MHFLDDPSRELQAAPAAGRLAEMGIDLARAAQSLSRGLTNIPLAMAIADAYEHGA